jgi:hypothetical protein
MIGMKQAYLVFRLTTENPVAIPKIHSRLAIHAQIGNFLVASQQ